MAPLRKKTKSPRKNPIERPVSPSSTIVVKTPTPVKKKHPKDSVPTAPMNEGDAPLQAMKMPRPIKTPLPTDRLTRSATKLADAKVMAKAAECKVLNIQGFPTEIRRQIFEELIGGYVISIQFDEVAPGKFELEKSGIPEIDVQILRVCKTWSDEAVSVLYGKNVFSVEDMDLFDRTFLSSITSANKAMIRKLAMKENPCHLPVQVEVDRLLRIHPQLFNLQSIDVSLVHCPRFLSQFSTEVMKEHATKERIMWTLYRLIRRFPRMTTMVEKTRGFEGHICLGIRVRSVKIGGTEIRHSKTEEKFYEDLKARTPDLCFPFRLAPL